MRGDRHGGAGDLKDSHTNDTHASTSARNTSNFTRLKRTCFTCADHLLSIPTRRCRSPGTLRSAVEGPMTQIMSIVISFVLVTIVGNFLMQRWQQNSWLRQQQFLGQEKEYAALRDFFPELSGAIGSRLYLSKRLFSALQSKDIDFVEVTLRDYDNAITSWNEAIGRFYAQLTIYVNYEYTSKLESTIHLPFQTIGTMLEQGVRARRQGTFIATQDKHQIEDILRGLNVANAQFNRNLLRTIDEKRKSVYFGRRLEYTETNLSKYSTWELIKALFAGDVDSYAIICAPSDSRFPTLSFFKWPWVH